MTPTIQDLPENAQVFVVGGWIRDKLLNRPSKDRDFVVVGATIQDMIDIGFKQVGADFPVFLHPATGDEFALARIERKTGPGYNGFTVDASPTITLQEDLFRRDLTINAMAAQVFKIPTDLDEDLTIGEIVDPFGGQRDLAAKKLRHVSDAFAEDPVRVLRVARFHVRFGFTVAKSTVDLMKQMDEDGELDHLVPERILAEFEKTLMEDNPQIFHLMAHVGLPKTCRKSIFPSMTETTVGNFQGLEIAALRRANLLSRWSLLFRDEKDTSLLVDLKASNDVTVAVQDFIEFAKFQTFGRQQFVMDMLVRLKAVNDEARLFQLVDTLQLTKNQTWMDMGDLLIKAWRACKPIKFASLSTDERQQLKGPEIQARIQELRKEAVDKFFV